MRSGGSFERLSNLTMVIENVSSETGLLGQRWERNLDIQPSQCGS